MSILTSPQQATRLLERRNLPNIPKDQQALLEKDDCWAVDLKNQPHGHLHVPGHVLEGVRAAYQARQKIRKPVPARQQKHSPVRSESSERSQNGIIASQVVQSPGRESSPEVLIEDWPPSPEPPERAALPAPESPIAHQLLNTTTTMAPPPPRPAARLMPAPRFEPPSSGAEEELETELPQPNVRRDVPVNRTASRLSATLESPIRSGRPTDTPPCAAQRTQASQQTVPGTVVQEPSVRESAGPEIRRKRRMKEITFSEGNTPKRLRSTMSRLPATRTFPDVVSSNSTSSSSIIPATLPDPSTYTSVMNSVEDRRLSGENHPPLRHEEEHTVPSSENRLSLQSQAHTQGSQPYRRATQTPGSQAYLRASQQSTQALMQIPINGDVNPFEAFSAVYPAYQECYSGTLWDFVKACVCLDHLRKRRSLRECLYDDFIRAFSDDYQTYVRNAGPGQEALPAVEWYNNLPGRCLFNKMVITRENLGYILDYYPKEVIQASRAIHVDTDADEELIYVQPTPAPVNQHTPAKSANSRPTESPKRDESEDIVIARTPLHPKSVAQRQYSSEPRPPLTQVPAPTSPNLGSSAPPSTITSTISKTRAPRPSQYFKRLSSSSLAPSSSRRRSQLERDLLRAHFLNLRRKSAGPRSSGANI